MRYFLAFLACFALVSPSQADTVTHGSGFQFWAPDNWSQAYDSEDDYQLTSPDGTATALFFVLPPESVDDAIDGATQALGELFTDLEISDEPNEVKINDLDAVVFDGTGTSDGVELKWGVGIVHYQDKFVLVIAFCAKESLELHDATLGKILNSLS